MRTIIAERALTPDGWRRDVAVSFDTQGRIAAVEDSPPRAPLGAMRAWLLLPAPANTHSHAFQRAMAGLTEYRTGDHDSFWTWRDLMYRFVDALTPDDVEAIASMAYVEMLEAGYASVGEFHYLHHGPGGGAYDSVGEMSARIVRAASCAGFGLTLLPVLYMRAGLDGASLEGGQLRFGNSIDGFAALYEAAGKSVAASHDDYVLGVAPHSLRAVDKAALDFAAGLSARAPVHIHIAEQEAEVEAVLAACGARPVEWLLDNLDVGPRWQLVHATHMTPDECAAAAATGAIAGLCPVTEANLGDGVFDAAGWRKADGAFSLGTDSNVNISYTEEARLLEYSQRLARRRRAVLADENRSCGRVIHEAAARDGARALGRKAGVIAPGALADFVTLKRSAPLFDGLADDRLLDAWIFAGGRDLVADVWSAGRHVVHDGRHLWRDAIEARYRTTMRALRARI